MIKEREDELEATRQTHKVDTMVLLEATPPWSQHVKMCSVVAHWQVSTIYLDSQRTNFELSKIECVCVLCTCQGVCVCVNSYKLQLPVTIIIR